MVQVHSSIEDALFERHVTDEINTAFNALHQENVPSGCNCDDMRVLVEWFERNGVMVFSGCFSFVMKLYQVGWRQGIIGEWVSIIVLSVLKLADTRKGLREHDLLQPGNYVREIEDSSRSIYIAGADWMGEWLKR